MLDALRGVCAIFIMVYHYLSWNGVELFQIGTFGVYIFFILSGFSMWYVYADSEITAQSLRAFYVSRFARIFPLYLLVNWKFVHHGLNPTYFKTFILNITFLFGLSSPGLTSGVTGGWSIGIEWVFYLAFPLLWVFLRSLKAMLILLVFSLIINQTYVASLFPKASFGELWIDYSQFPVFIVYFIAGIAGANLYQKFYHHRPQGLSAFQQWLAVTGIIVCMVLVFAYPSEDIKDYLWGWHFLLLIFASSLAVFLCALVQDLSPFAIRVCKFLGDISFSTYLTHYLVYKYGLPFFQKHSTLEVGYILPILWCITLVSAYVLYRFYEMPARKFINRIFGGHQVH